MSAVKYVAGACLAILVFVLFIALVTNGSESPEHLEARKRECTAAIMSGIGTSTRNYTDKAAYEANVREHCRGLEMSGIALDK
ncbi:hypothetical protein H372_027010 [Burkholderia pseudomallei CS]|uniref:hypothetical protein n=1 Tax=Burkholderia pseudomallei TaxID=28450 RepID=UPI001E31CCF3|nr:hypothetical protein [Burkholderia pseudomallei]MCE2035833.1 hypothetical protein [Burkholderia pseudomallei CS]MCE2041841.1 hypothetical protein [Burkholderia pseudomallei CB]